MLNIGEFARLGQVSPRMLRHYDEIGLLRPAMVDTANGYRLYSVHQLPSLHRIVAMRDLGMRLEDIAPLLESDITLEGLRSLLSARQQELREHVETEISRLRRVEAHLRALEALAAMTNPVVSEDFLIKKAHAVRLAELRATAPGYGAENISPVFAELAPTLSTELRKNRLHVGTCWGYYEPSTDDEGITVHVAFDIGDQDITAAADGESAVPLSVTTLPPCEVASVVYRGGPEGISGAFERLYRWVEDSGRAPNGFAREIYHEWRPDDPALSVTELQVPVG